MTRKWLVAIFSAAALTVSGGAAAQALSGFYVGIDVGQADFGSEDDTAIKIHGGYQFHTNIAAEVAYSQLLDKGGVEVTALEVVAVGIFPVAPQISLLGKFGLARLDASPGGDETEITFGFGAQYDFNRNIGARLQWQRYNTDPDEVDLFSIGVVYRF